MAELRTCLERKRVEPAAIDIAVEELTEAGFLDDARYARRFAEDKRELEQWGSERIARDLQRRGVAPDLIEDAVVGQARAEPSSRRRCSCWSAASRTPRATTVTESARGGCSCGAGTRPSSRTRRSVAGSASMSVRRRAPRGMTR